MPDSEKNNKDVCKWHFAVESEIKSLKEARNLARSELERRLEGMNEFRDQLRSQAGTFVTREVADTRYGIIDKRVKTLEEKRSNLEGRMWAIPVAIVIVQILLMIAAVILKLN